MFAKRNLAVLGAMVWLLGMVGSVHAALYDVPFSGSIHEVRDAAGQRIGTTVDQWHFSTVGGSTDLSIDILSWEAEAPNSAGEYAYIELVGQGSPQPAFFDTWIYLFEADPFGNPADLIAENDDNPNWNYNDDIFGAGWRDGSISSTDSYLRLSVPEGDYVLAIGAYELTESSARAGLNQSGSGGYWNPLSIDDPDGDGWGPLIEGFSMGDYAITLSTECGNVVVPEPASLAVWMVLGIIGIVAIRNAKRVKERHRVPGTRP